MYMTLHHASRDNMKKDEPSPAAKSYALFLARQKEAIRVTRHLADMACWLEWRCPELWRLAGESIEQRLPVRPAWTTLRGGQFIEALRLAGLMSPALAAEAMRPFAQLEAVRSAYVVNAPTFGNRSPLITIAHLESLNEKRASDDRSGRFGSLRSRRVGFLAKGRGRSSGASDSAHQGSGGDAGAPESTASGARAARQDARQACASSDAR